MNLQRCKDSDGEEIFKVFSKVVMFTTIDDAWREHLREMDDLRQSVQNATYEQKDPLLIYKLESFQLFSKMLNKVNADVLSTLNKPTSGTGEYGRERTARTPGASQSRCQQVAGFAHASCGTGGTDRKTEADARACREKSRPQRSLSLRQRQKIQELSRQGFITAKTDRRWVTRKRNNTSSTCATCAWHVSGRKTPTACAARSGR